MASSTDPDTAAPSSQTISSISGVVETMVVCATLSKNNASPVSARSSTPVRFSRWYQIMSYPVSQVMFAGVVT